MLKNGPEFYTCELHLCPQTGKTISVRPPEIQDGKGMPTSLFKILPYALGVALIECRKCGQIVAVVQ